MTQSFSSSESNAKNPTSWLLQEEYCTVTWKGSSNWPITASSTSHCDLGHTKRNALTIISILDQTKGFKTQRTHKVEIICTSAEKKNADICKIYITPIPEKLGGFVKCYKIKIMLSVYSL